MATTFVLPFDADFHKLCRLFCDQVDERLRFGDFIGSNTKYVPEHGIDVVATLHNIQTFVTADNSQSFKDYVQRDSFIAKITAQGKQLFVGCIMLNLPITFLWRGMYNTNTNDSHSLSPKPPCHQCRKPTLATTIYYFAINIRFSLLFCKKMFTIIKFPQYQRCP
jgi:hypothetical protein